MLLAAVATAGMVHTWWRFLILERIQPDNDPRA